MSEEYQLPSDLFIKSLRTTGSISVDCACGVTHYASHGDFEEGELEELQNKARRIPDQYNEVTDDDMVSYTIIDSKQIVIQCGCNLLGDYERLFLEEKGLIIDFLTSVNEEEAKQETYRIKEAEKLAKLAK